MGNMTIEDADEALDRPVSEKNDIRGISPEGELYLISRPRQMTRHCQSSLNV